MMRANDKNIKITDKMNTSEDGFRILIRFHRLAGILYLDYDQNAKKWQRICLVLWAIFVWSLVALANIPCLLNCYTEEFKNINGINFYLLNVIFIVFMVINILSAIIYTMRGHAFRLVVEDMNKLVINKKYLKSLRLLLFLYITLSVLFILAKIIIIRFHREFHYTDLIRVWEDIFSEIMADQTGLLLMFFSYFISIIIEELNQSIKNTTKLETNEIDFDDIYEKITKIQKIIKRVNSLLSPCLLLMFVLNIFFLITIGYFVQNYSDSLVSFTIKDVWPIILVHSLRMFFWCLFVDKMNQKVCYKKKLKIFNKLYLFIKNKKTFELISSKNMSKIEDKIKV